MSSDKRTCVNARTPSAIAGSGRTSPIFEQLSSFNEPDVVRFYATGSARGGTG